MNITILCRKLFLLLCLMSAFSAHAQIGTAWTPGSCQCPNGFIFAQATAPNCTQTFNYEGCINPNVGANGTCFDCGQGGTRALNSYGCMGGLQNQEWRPAFNAGAVECAAQN